MIYAKFTDEGVLDWTSEVPQEGLAAMDLPAAGEGDEIRLEKDGTVSLIRAGEPGEFLQEVESVISEALMNLEAASFFWALHNLMIEEKTEEGSIGAVSVLIPCYGKAAFVKETVQSAAAQTKPAEEIRVLLMDEASQAMQAELEALGKNVVCETHEQMDVVSARNYLAKKCKSEYFVFLDADDLLDSDFLEKACGFRSDFIAGACGFVFDGEKHAAPDFFYGNLTGVFRRDAFLDLGGLDAAFSECGREDTEFLLRAIFSGKSFRVEKSARYWIRRDRQNLEWKASSFTESDIFQNTQKTAVRMLLEKHRIGFPGKTRAAIKKDDILSQRYVEDGNLCHLYYSLKDSNFFRLKVCERLFQQDVFSCGMFPGRSFSAAPIFTGDFSQWRFLNCKPSAGQLAFIKERFMGRRFDVLFLSLPLDGKRPCFADLFRGTDKAMVHRSFAFSETSGSNFRIEAYRNFFCVHAPVFLEETTVYSSIAEDLTWDDVRTLVPDGAESNLQILTHFDKAAYRQTYGRPYMQMITFELNKECNRDCAYCTQARGRPFPHYDDEEIFSRFDKMLSHLEKITDGKISPQIMGGEPTLWSGALIEKILERLSDYPQVVVVTNHDKKDSAWERSPKVIFYTHLVDWEGMGKLPPAKNEGFMIVVTKQNLPFLEDFIRANAGQQINIDAYIGEDESLALSDEDRKIIAEIEAKYPAVDGAILASVRTGYKSIVAPEECVGKANIWRADCTSMTVCPCCGRDQKVIPYAEFTGQLPCLEDCGDCAVLYRFENFLL